MTHKFKTIIVYVNLILNVKIVFGVIPVPPLLKEKRRNF